MASRSHLSTHAWPIPVDTDQDTSKEVTPSPQPSQPSPQFDTGLEACPQSTLQVFEESHKQVHQPDFSLQVVPDSYKQAHRSDYVWAEAVQSPAELDETKDQTPPPRPWWKRRRIWIAAAGVILATVAIVVGCVVGLRAGKNASSTDSSPAPSGGSGGGSGNSGNNNSFPLFPLDPNFRSACRGTTCGQLFTAQKFVDDTLHLFARGRDGAMWTRVYDGSSWTGSWKSLGGNFQSQPESAVWGLNRKRISVLGVSRDGGKVMTKAYRNGTWESEWLYTNATTNSPITACYIPFRTGNSEYVDTFARSPASSEQGLMTSRLFGEDDPGFKKSPNYPNQYSDKWETHNLGGILGSSIAVACRLMDSLITQDLIMYQRGTRSVAHTQRREPNARLMTWNDRGGSFAGEPVIAASSNSETDPRIDFFGTGQDKKMYHFGWSKSANYTPLESIGGEFQSVPVVLVTTSSRLDVLAVGTDDRLKHRAYINSKWAGEWEDLGVLANSAPYVVGLPSSPYKIGVFVLGKDNDVLFSTWEVSSSPSWKNLAGFVSIQGDLTAAWMESEP